MYFYLREPKEAEVMLIFLESSKTAFALSIISHAGFPQFKIPNYDPQHEDIITVQN
jgi:hypothetical protein